MRVEYFLAGKEKKENFSFNIIYIQCIYIKKKREMFKIARLISMELVRCSKTPLGGRQTGSML